MYVYRAHKATAYDEKAKYPLFSIKSHFLCMCCGHRDDKKIYTTETLV